MTPSEAGKLGGRPKKKIDEQQFEAMCSIQCTKDEICNILNCNEQTLTRWCKDTYNLAFCDIYKRFADTGKRSIRRYQFELAKKNTAMAIWLGKQYLGQRDSLDLSSNDANEMHEVKITIVDNSDLEKELYSSETNNE